MCGVAGSFSYDASVAVNVDALHQVSATMQTRGPDGDGFWKHHTHSIALAHRRLAVIDLSEGAAQPMSDPSGRYVISYNGEIYNYIELREHCVKKGYQFSTHSDTEVLLALYQFYQVEMLSKLRGMFAFALCDVQEETVLLARDPHGIKPLYYVDYDVKGDEGCLFSSSLKALRQAGLIDSKNIDQKAVAGFQHMGSVPEPITWFKQAKLLPAGSYRVLSRESKTKTLPEVKQYWSLKSCFLNTTSNIENSIKQEIAVPNYQNIIHQALADSVQAHMVADVPVGLFLSAGIDSSVLATLMRQCGDQRIKAITLRFAEYEGTADDESIIAAEIARRHGLEHHIYTLGYDEFIQELPQFFASMEQPTIDGLNTWFVAKAAKSLGLKVVLSGVGGDEIFGGYPSFSSVPKFLTWGGLFSAVFKLPFANLLFEQIVKRLNLNNKNKWMALPTSMNSLLGAYRLQRGIFLKSELNAKEQTALTQLEDLLNVDESLIKKADHRRNISLLESQCYLRNQLLRDADWASMAHSIEIRTPLVDSHLSEILASVPEKVLYGNNKSALAALLSIHDYELLANKPKTGFTLPMQKWLSAAGLVTKKNHSHWSRGYAQQVMIRFSEVN